MGQAVVGRPRREAHPANGAAVLVADQARRRPIAGQSREPLAVAIGARVRPVKAADPVELAPAPLGVAALLEERGQVVPAVRREWVDRDRVTRFGIDRHVAMLDGALVTDRRFCSVPGSMVPTRGAFGSRLRSTRDHDRRRDPRPAPRRRAGGAVVASGLAPRRGPRRPRHRRGPRGRGPARRSAGSRDGRAGRLDRGSPAPAGPRSATDRGNRRRRGGRPGRGRASDPATGPRRSGPRPPPRPGVLAADRRAEAGSSTSPGA